MFRARFSGRHGAIINSVGRRQIWFGELFRSTEVARASVSRRVIRPVLDRIPGLFEQHGEVVSGVGVAALGRACQRVFGLAKHVRAGQEHRELECAVSIAALVSTLICRGSAGYVAALFE